MTTFEKAVAAQGAESLLIEAGHFGIPQAETALDRGLADVNAELRKELTELRAENNRLKAEIDELSGRMRNLQGASAMTEQQRAEYMAIVAANSPGNWNGDAARVARWALRIWEEADALIDDGD